MNESNLIKDCKAQKRKAQRDLFNLYWELIFKICVRYLTVQQNAEEAASNCFIKAFKRMEQFEYRGEGSFRAWISKIAVNECLMQLRNYQQNWISVDDLKIEPIDLNSEKIIDQMSSAELLKTIQQLPIGYRTVFNLYFFENLSHKEIGRLLNISENTSKSQLSKARATLREKLKGYGKV